MALMTYTSNRDAASFVSAVTLGSKTIYIGDTIDLTASEQTTLAPYIVLMPGTVVVDLSKFPYDLAEEENFDPNFTF